MGRWFTSQAHDLILIRLPKNLRDGSIRLGKDALWFVDESLHSLFRELKHKATCQPGLSESYECGGFEVERIGTAKSLY